MLSQLGHSPPSSLAYHSNELIIVLKASDIGDFIHLKVTNLAVSERH